MCVCVCVNLIAESGKVVDTTGSIAVVQHIPRRQQQKIIKQMINVTRGLMNLYA